MVLDFGYVTLFAAAMPLASSLTILTNVAEIYLDYIKLHFVCCRPMPVRSGSMPRTWFHVISGMCSLAIVTNVLFTFLCSDQVYNMMGNLYRKAEVEAGDHSVHTMSRRGMWALFGVEHAMFLAAVIARHTIPSEAKWVSHAVEAREYRRRAERTRKHQQKIEKKCHGEIAKD